MTLHLVPIRSPPAAQVHDRRTAPAARARESRPRRCIGAGNRDRSEMPAPGRSHLAAPIRVAWQTPDCKPPPRLIRRYPDPTRSSPPPCGGTVIHSTENSVQRPSLMSGDSEASSFTLHLNGLIRLSDPS